MAHHVVVTGAAANGGQRNARLAALACAAALLTLVVALAVNGDGKDEVGGGRRRNVLFQWETRNDPAEVGMSDLIKGADADDPAFKLSDFSLYPRTERMTQSAETRCPMCTGTNAYYKWERDAYKGTNDLLAPAAAAAAATGPVPISESSSGSAQMMAPIAPPAPKTAAEVRGESLGTADAGVRNRAEAYGRMLQRIGSKMSETESELYVSEEDRARLNQAIKQVEEKERAIGTLHGDLVQEVSRMLRKQRALIASMDQAQAEA